MLTSENMEVVQVAIRDAVAAKMNEHAERATQGFTPSAMRHGAQAAPTAGQQPQHAVNLANTFGPMLAAITPLLQEVITAGLSAGLKVALDKLGHAQSQ